MRAGIRGLHHVGISVPDLDAAKSFYVDVLGMRVVSSRPWKMGDARMDEILGLQDSSGERALLEGLDTRLELWQFSTPSGEGVQIERRVSDLGLAHLCFEVDDLMSLYEQLRSSGVSFLSRPSRGPSGSVAVYGRDPFGNHLEFFQAPRTP